MATDGILPALLALDLEPLWERREGGLRPAPEPETPKLWRWREIEALVDDVIASVPMDQVERRVLTLKNPDPRYQLTTTIRNINCGIQILMPGETAPPHRHSPNAIRVALEGEGGETTVNGVAYEMRRGDVILTPAWTSHAHDHRGDGRVIWIDFLDVPMYRNLYLIYFEPGVEPGVEDGAAGGGVGAHHAGALPVGRFPWADISERLKGDCASQTYDYVDPVIGDAALATLDCRALRLAANAVLPMGRSSAGGICLVLDGSGESEIGATALAWSRNDLFTLPHGLDVEHRAGSDGADLICVSDRPALRRLGLLQEEFPGGTGTRG